MNRFPSAVLPLRIGVISYLKMSKKSSSDGAIRRRIEDMATQTRLIRGKVAEILSPLQVAVNVGQNHGVKPGMLFDILSKKGRGIKDPDSGEELGSVGLPKARVRISDVYEKFSVARTNQTKRVNVGGYAGKLGDSLGMFEPPKWVERPEPLKIRSEDLSPNQDLEEHESYVDIGDVVVQVLDEEQA